MSRKIFGWQIGLAVVLLGTLGAMVFAQDLRSVLQQHDPNGTAAVTRTEVSTATPGIEQLTQTGTVHVYTALNIRTSPWGTIIGKFKDGDQIQIIGREGDWFKITWNGRTAYCHSNYVSLNEGNNNGGGSDQAPDAGSGSTTGTGDSAALNAWRGGRLEPSQFVRLLGPAARESMRRTGVPASVTLAQAALETGWGRATIGDAKNLFGIKGTGPAGSIRVPTREVINGRSVTINDNFRKYNNWSESIDDHARLLQGARYRPAMAVRNSPDEFARQLQRCGYATDPNYARTLISIMSRYNLYQYDR